MKKTLFITVFILLAIIACKKNSSTTGSSTGTNPGTTTTKYYGKFTGGEVIVDSSASTSNVVLFISNFYKYPDSAITDAGTVKAGIYQLVQIFGLSSPYLYYGGGSWTGGKIPWTISGSANVAAFNYTCTKGLPSMPVPTSSLTINRSAGYTFTSTATTADSIVFQIDDGNNTVSKTLKGNITSYTFSAAELSALAAGNNNKSYISAQGINTESATVNGKNYTFQSMRNYMKYKISIL